MRISLFVVGRWGVCCLALGVLLGGCCSPPALGKVDQEREMSIEVPLHEPPEVPPLKRPSSLKEKPILKAKKRQQAPIVKKGPVIAGLPEKDQASLKKKKQEKTPELVLLRTVDKLALPQSVLFDRQRLRFYVSRLGGDQPKSGAIALLARDGSVINAKWATGLEQPRGMALAGQRLYVADGKALVAIDVESGKITQRFVAPKAFYLNDVVKAPNGHIYVTDPLTNSIYVLRDGTAFDVWLQNEALSGPNGIIVLGDDLIVGSIGLQRDKKTKGLKGAVFRVSLTSRAVRSFANGALPAIASVGADGEGHLYATDDGGALLLKFSANNGRLLERLDVGKAFKLKDTAGLGDFTYLLSSKEFWVPVKSNGHILVFGRKDAQLTTEDQP